MRNAWWLMTAVVLAGASAHAAVEPAAWSEHAAASAAAPTLAAARAAGPDGDVMDALQFDGDAHGDAADTCAESPRIVAVPVRTSGLLVPRADTVDLYGLSVTRAHLGETLAVTIEWKNPLVTADPALASKLAPRVALLAPDCSTELASAGIGEGPVRVSTVLRHAGVHVLSVTISERLAGAPQHAPASLAERADAAQVCHDFCVKMLNDLGGYVIQTVRDAGS